MAKAKKLPSGSWRVQVSAGEKGADGKYKYISITAPTEKEANLAALEYELKHKEISRNPANMTLSEAMRKYIDSKSNVLSPLTIAGYNKIKRNNLKNLMQLKLNKLNNNIIQAEINNEARKNSPKTVANVYGLLCAVLKIYCFSLNLNITLPKKEKKDISILNSEQIAVLINAIDGKEIEIPVLLSVWLGLRKSEICDLCK